MQTTIRFENLNKNSEKPTIWDALATKLGREPTNEEITAEVKRILSAPLS